MRISGASSLLLATACAAVHVHSSAHATGRALPPSSGAVLVTATSSPPGAEELGIVEVHGRLAVATLEQLVGEFRGRVALLGGDRGRIDALSTRYQWVTEEYTYDCSTTEIVFETRSVTRVGADGSTTTSSETVPVTKTVSKTCTGERQVEVATTTLVGRAFLTKRGGEP
jgi:hypothetical protein